MLNSVCPDIAHTQLSPPYYVRTLHMRGASSPTANIFPLPTLLLTHTPPTAHIDMPRVMVLERQVNKPYRDKLIALEGIVHLHFEV